MKYKQPPLWVDCSGLTKKLTKDLADRFSWCFEVVNVYGDEIELDKPVNEARLSRAWDIIDKWGLQWR